MYVEGTRIYRMKIQEYGVPATQVKKTSNMGPLLSRDCWFRVCNPKAASYGSGTGIPYYYVWMEDEKLESLGEEESQPQSIAFRWPKENTTY